MKKGDNSMSIQEQIDEEGLKLFLDKMRQKLRGSEHYPPWQDVSSDLLFLDLIEEIGELAKALRNEEPIENIILECADVANVAMMIANRTGMRKMETREIKVEENIGKGWEQWVVDVTLDKGEGIYCFCPIEGEIGEGEYSIVFGMDILSPIPPGKLVGVIHADGDEAVTQWCETNKNILEDWKQ